MGRKIICESCGTKFQEDLLRDATICPVCGKSLIDDASTDKVEAHKATTKWYYYKEGGGGLVNMLFDDWTPLYTFDAVDLQDAERQLKEVMPNNPLTNPSPTPQIRCPRCFSTEFQLVPKKFSLLTGFATNRYDRVCNHCGKRF